MNSFMDFPPASVNNARKIAKELEEAWQRTPCGYNKERLEKLGYTVDWTEKDMGNEQPEVREYEGEMMSDEELAKVL